MNEETAAAQAAEGMSAGERPGEDAEAVRRRSARRTGVAAYLTCVKAGDEEEAARIAGEVQELGLSAPDGKPGKDRAAVDGDSGPVKA